MKKTLRWLRKAAGWVLVTVSGLTLMTCLICIILMPFGGLDISSPGEAVAALLCFAVYGAVSALLVFLGWRMRGDRRVLMIPLRQRLQWLRPWLRHELSRVKRKEHAPLRPKNLNLSMAQEKEPLVSMGWIGGRSA